MVELYGELELYQMLTQFFDRAVYYGIMAYGKAERQDSEKSILSSVAPPRQSRLAQSSSFGGTFKE